MADEIIIKKLEAASQDQVSRFRMKSPEDKPLEQFIRRTALKSANANLTQTYVAKLAEEPHVIAFITVMCAEVALQKSYNIEDKAGADKWEYQPAVRIARLA